MTHSLWGLDLMLEHLSVGQGERRPRRGRQMVFREGLGRALGRTVCGKVCQHAASTSSLLSCGGGWRHSQGGSL